MLASEHLMHVIADGPDGSLYRLEDVAGLNRGKDVVLRGNLTKLLTSVPDGPKADVREDSCLQEYRGCNLCSSVNVLGTQNKLVE